MARFRVLFESKKIGAINFEAEDIDQAKDIYEELIDGLVYVDELEDAYEDIEDHDVTYFELTTASGQVLAN